MPDVTPSIPDPGPDRVSRAARLSAVAFVVGLAASVHGQSVAELSAQDLQFFESKVRPLLIKHCYQCHASEGGRIRGGLVLDTRDGWMLGGISGPAVVPGDPDASLLLEAVRGEDPDFQMPPNRRLGEAEVAIFEEWVRRGAPDPRVPDPDATDASPVPGGGVPKEAAEDHWAFAPVRSLAPPEVADSRWCSNEIDAFILAGLDADGLKPANRASRTALIRRLSFDLRGHQPSPEEVEDFLADRTDQAWSALVDRFLASPAFGERWGRHWLDVARFAESSGKEQDVPYPHAWRYRDWVIRAINEDLPYDQFLRMQLAGDLLGGRTRDEVGSNLVATGYLAVGPKSHRERQRRQFELDVADEQIDAITQGMLGLTVSCARCHDHKYDPVSQQDYYQLAGIMMSSETLFGGYGTRSGMQSDLIDLARSDSIGDGLSIPAGLYARLLDQHDGLGSQISELESRRASGNVTDSEYRQRMRTLRQRQAPVEEVLTRFDEGGAPTSLNKVAMGIRDDAAPADARLLIRGELDNPAETVPRGVPPIADLRDPILIQEGSGRLELANWIASEGNPLTARVMSNRIWLHLFGSGIVSTTENFGLEGAPPSHPALLDHLATRFVAHGWSVKNLVREIVHSSAYRMATDEHPAGMRTDPDNTRYWRMSPYRLEGEAIRDAILFAAGTIELGAPGGSKVSWLPGRVPGDGYLVEAMLSSDARSIYLPQMRTLSAVILETFDGPESSFVTGDREETNVPSQALLMLNSDWVTRQADEMASMLLSLDVDDRRRQEIAFLRTLGRPPTSLERSAIRRFFADLGALLEDGEAIEDQRGQQTRDRVRRRNQRRRGLAEAPETPLERHGGSARDQARLVAWSALCQSIFASAEFRYLD